MAGNPGQPRGTRGIAVARRSPFGHHRSCDTTDGDQHGRLSERHAANRRRNGDAGMTGAVIALIALIVLYGWIRDQIAALGITENEAFAGGMALFALVVVLWIRGRRKAAAEQSRHHEELAHTTVLQGERPAHPVTASRPPGLLASPPGGVAARQDASVCLAKLKDVEAVITYVDSAGTDSIRRVGFRELWGERDADGARLRSALAWCYDGGRRRIVVHPEPPAANRQHADPGAIPARDDADLRSVVA